MERKLTPEAGTLVDFLEQSASRFGERPALLYKHGLRYRSWSYARLWEEAGQVASLLRQRGLDKGDRVVIWGPNCPQWVLAFFGCLRAGVIVVPLDMRSPADFVRRVLEKTQPRLAITSRLTPRDGIEPGVPELLLEEIEELYQGLPAPPEVNATAEDLVEVMFTSGTTGDPKGVMLSHINLLANLEGASRYVPGSPSDRLLSILPLSHMFEQTGGLLMPLRCGANITYPTSRQPTVLLKTMRERKVTLLLLVPQALDLFMKGIEREVARQGREVAWRSSLKIARLLPLEARRLLFRRVHGRFGNGLRVIFSGGAALDPQLGAKWDRVGMKVIQGYGATEASPVISCHTMRSPRFDSVGLPLPGVDVRIAEDGEIWVRGPNVTSGYWEAPEQTALAFEEGWYKTGDVGLVDKRGFLHIKGRKKDMIVLASGQNVFPEDIESVLKQHPAVKDAVVVGLPQNGDSEVHAAFITEEPETAPQVVFWANAQLAEHQQVRGFTIWPDEDFPRTHTLKVKKGIVLEELMGTTDRGPKALAQSTPSQESRGVRHLIAEVGELPLDQVTADKTLGSDLNLDSLKRIELLSLIEEEMGVYIDESTAGQATTVAQLEELVAGHLQTSAAIPRFHTWPLSGWCRALREMIQRAVVFPLLAAGYRPTVKGLENLDGLQPPVIFAVNHNAIQWDSLILIKALPRRWRTRLAFAAAAEITFGKLWLGVVASIVANAFPLYRDTAIRPSLEHIGRLLDAGWNIGIFPEGDQRVGEEMLPFQSGSGLLGVECRTPVVPVRLESGMPRPRKVRVEMLPWREPVTVRIGAAITFAPGTSYAEATSVIEEAVRTL